MSKASLFKLIAIIILLTCTGILLFHLYYKPSLSQPYSTTSRVVEITQEPTSTAMQQETVLASVPTWIPSALWTKPSAISEQTSYGELSGTEIHTTITSQKSYYGNFEQKDMLSKMGFVEDVNLAASGPLGDLWGYKKDREGQRQVLILSFANDPSEFIAPGKLNCPCKVTISAFLSNFFSPKQ